MLWQVRFVVDALGVLICLSLRLYFDFDNFVDLRVCLISLGALHVCVLLGFRSFELLSVEGVSLLFLLLLCLVCLFPLLFLFSECFFAPRGTCFRSAFIGP